MSETHSSSLVRERPILFSSPMVQAILAGRKTQTRRVITPQPDNVVLSYYPSGLHAHALVCPESGIQYGYGFEDDQRIWKCPYGAYGDLLWVRETWRETGSGQRADGKIPKIKVPCIYKADDPLEGPFRPSIHMPSWASRITLEVTDVRVERVQEISEEDAIAEGFEACHVGDGSSATDAFECLWEIINGKRPGCAWGDNPWVWVITFRKV